MQKHAWLVGASSGIGLELVKLFLQDGYTVIASAREAKSTANLLVLKEHYKERLKLLNVDVSSYESLDDATEYIWKNYGHIHVCLFNAAVYEVMPCDAWQMKHFEAMCNINYLGGVRFINVLLPFLRAQGFGRVVFNCSLSSYFGLPLGGGYSAPKAALVNFAQAIQPELLIENIEVQIINHGFVKTRLTAKNDFDMPELLSPKEAAQEIFEALLKPYRFEIRFPFKLSWFLRLLQIIPWSLSLKITKRLLQ